jgi:hypothetical protein
MPMTAPAIHPIPAPTSIHRVGQVVAAEERPLHAEPNEKPCDRAGKSGSGRQADDGERRSMTTSTGHKESTGDESPHSQDLERRVERVPGAGTLDQWHG